MFTPPCRAALPIFADNDSKPHTGTTFAVLTTLAQFQHSIALHPRPPAAPCSKGLAAASLLIVASLAQYSGATTIHAPSPRCW